MHILNVQFSNFPFTFSLCKISELLLKFKTNKPHYMRGDCEKMRPIMLLGGSWLLLCAPSSLGLISGRGPSAEKGSHRHI